MIIAFNSSVVSDDFCKAFRGLGNRISYLYKQGLRDVAVTTNITFHVIVNGQYWDLVFDTQNQEVWFDSQVNQSAPVFTDQYFGAAYYWRAIDNNEKADTLLFPRGETIDKVMVTRIPNQNHMEVRQLKDFSEPEERNVSGLPRAKYGFVHTSQRYKGMDFAVGQQPGKAFTRMYYLFTGGGEKGFDALSLHDDDTNITIDFNLDKELIGMWIQWSYNRGHILLLRDNQEVFWCWRKSDEDEVCNDSEDSNKYSLVNHCFSASRSYWSTVPTRLVPMEVRLTVPFCGL